MNPDYKRSLYERGRDRLASLLGRVEVVAYVCMYEFMFTKHTYIGYPEGGGKDATTLSLLTRYGDQLFSHN